MLSIKGHFDGNAIVLDEPATLAVGQAVQIVVEDPDTGEPHDRLKGLWKDKLHFIKDVDHVIEQHWGDWYKENTP